ncbi:MAG: hypothetical protein WCE63_20425 [Acidobacteriaceae bacterium]
MTTSQLYLAIFVPCFSILIVWLGSTMSNRQGMKSVSKSIDDLGTSLRAEMKAGFNAVDQRLTRLETTVDRIDGEIRIDHERRIVKLEERVLSKAS